MPLLLRLVRRAASRARVASASFLARYHRVQTVDGFEAASVLRDGLEVLRLSKKERTRDGGREIEVCACADVLLVDERKHEVLKNLVSRRLQFVDLERKSWPLCVRPVDQCLRCEVAILGVRWLRRHGCRRVSGPYRVPISYCHLNASGRQQLRKIHKLFYGKSRLCNAIYLGMSHHLFILSPSDSPIYALAHQSTKPAPSTSYPLASNLPSWSASAFAGTLSALSGATSPAYAQAGGSGHGPGAQTRGGGQQDRHVIQMIANASLDVVEDVMRRESGMYVLSLLL